jgi:hypothetical protein
MICDATNLPLVRLSAIYYYLESIVHLCPIWQLFIHLSQELDSVPEGTSLGIATLTLQAIGVPLTFSSLGAELTLPDPRAHQAYVRAAEDQERMYSRLKF